MLRRSRPSLRPSPPPRRKGGGARSRGVGAFVSSRPLWTTAADAHRPIDAWTPSSAALRAARLRGRPVVSSRLPPFRRRHPSPRWRSAADRRAPTSARRRRPTRAASPGRQRTLRVSPSPKWAAARCRRRRERQPRLRSDVEDDCARTSAGTSLGGAQRCSATKRQHQRSKRRTERRERGGTRAEREMRERCVCRGAEVVTTAYTTSRELWGRAALPTARTELRAGRR